MSNGETGNQPLQPTWLWYILSFLIPLLGIIFGIIYIKKPEPTVKKFGKTCLTAALIAVGLWCLCWIIWILAFGGLAMLGGGN